MASIQHIQGADESVKIEGLNELCTMLCIGMEEYVYTFDVSSNGPILVNLVDSENFQVKLLSCRAIALILDVVPRSCRCLIDLGVVPALTRALIQSQDIECMEEILKAFNFIALESPQSLLTDETTLNNILNKIDLIPDQQQVVVISIVSNLCREISADGLQPIEKTLSKFSSMLQTGNDNIVDTIIRCFVNLLDRFYDNEEVLSRIFTRETLSNVEMRLQKIIDGNLKEVKIAAMFIKLLSLFSNASTPLTEMIVESGVLPMLKDIIAPEISFTTDASIASLSRSDELVENTLHLINTILPDLPKGQVAHKIYPIPKYEWQWMDDFNNCNPYHEEANDEINEAYAQRKSEVMVFAVGNQYRVNLKEMKQYNTGTNQSRNIKRSTLPVGYERRTDTISMFGSDKSSSSSSQNSSDEIQSTESKRKTKKRKRKASSSALFKKIKSVINSKNQEDENMDEYQQSSSSGFDEKNTEELDENENKSPEASSSSSSRRRRSPVSLPTEERAKILFENEDNATMLIDSLVEPIIQLYSMTASLPAEQDCAIAISKILQFADPMFIRSSIKLHVICSFVVRLFTNSDSVVLTHAIHQALTLITKIGDDCLKLFIREGIATYLSKIIDDSSNVTSQVQDQARRFLDSYINSNEFSELQNKELGAFIHKLESSPESLEVLDNLPQLLDSSISMFQFTESEFTQKFLNYLCGSDSETKGKRLTAILKEHPESMQILVLLLQNSLNTVEKFPDIFKVDSFDVIGNNLPEEEELDLLGEPLVVHLKPHRSNDDNDGDNNEAESETKAETFTVQVDPVTSIFTISSFIGTKQKKENHEFQVYINGVKLEPHLSLIQAILHYSDHQFDGFMDIWNSADYTLTFEDLGIWPTAPKTSKKHKKSSSSSSTQEEQPMSDTVSQSDYPSRNQSCVDFTFHSNFSLSPLLCSSIDLSNYSKAPSSDDQSLQILLLLRLLNAINQNSDNILGIDDDSNFNKAKMNTNNTDNNDSYNNNNNNNNTIISQELFINQALNMKLLRQLQHPLSTVLALCRSMPSWCDILFDLFPFLLSFTARRLYFYFINFGALADLLKRYENEFYHPEETMEDIEMLEDAEEMEEDEEEEEEEHIEESICIEASLKVKVDRSKILDEAIELMHKYAGTKSRIDIEYEGEVGTGLGPSMEFYTIACREFLRRDLKLWWDSQEQSMSTTNNNNNNNNNNNIEKEEKQNYVQPAHGVYPLPLAQSREDAVFYFNTLGKLVGQALQDNRLLDLPLSESFLQVLCGGTLDPSFAEYIDPQIYRSLQQLSKLADKKDSETAETISSMGLTFTYNDVEIVENGSQKEVTQENLSEYICAVLQYIVQHSVQHQMTAFKMGLATAVNPKSLHSFSPSELLTILCGAQEKWDQKVLTECITCGHGYTEQSQPVKQLIQILSKLNTEDQCAFLKFTTGSTRLPAGGLRALRPKLTVVKAIVDKPDEMLPTCNTCFHYLKLPEYSSPELLKEKLLRALHYGQNSFDLS